MTITPTNEPQEVIAGDTVKWDRNDLSDYPANDGWVLTYKLLNAAGKIEITASASGANHSVNVAAATTANWAAGSYVWQAYATKAATSERYKVDEGTMVVQANFAALNSLDSRSHNKKVLDAICAVIENRATLDQESYSIMGRSLNRTPLKDLLLLKDKYQALYNAEQNAENVRNGAAGKNRIAVQF